MDKAHGPNVKLGIEVLYTAPSERRSPGPIVDVLAVHGIGADPDRTWTTGGVNWLKDEYMLPAALPNSRILRFGYESQWLGKDAIQQRLSSVAEQLLRGLMETRKALVSAKLHEEDYPFVIRSVAGVVFLGTPHRGSNSQSKASVLASIASSVALGEHSSLLDTLDKDSEILADLLHDFTRTVNTIGIPLFCFFEQWKSDVGKMLKFKGHKIIKPSIKDAVVDEHSGCLDGHPKLGLASDHFQLNKFPSPEDSNYRLVCEEIVRMFESAPGRVNGRRKSVLFAQPSPGEYEASDYVGSLSGLTLQAPTAFEERDRASIQALFITDPADDMQMIANKKDKLLETTDSWMLNDVAFRRWLDEDCSRVLWLHGNPGKGKTMLAIALIDELTKRRESAEKGLRQALVYFFCDNQDDRRGNASLILRGIIYQILCQHPGLAVYLNNEYEKQREQLFSSPNSLQTLWRIFHNIIKNSDLQEVYIVIDALDECDIDSMETLLVLLEPYIDVQNDDIVPIDQQAPFCRMKWLLTSRNEPRISQLLTGSLDISLEENSNHVYDAVCKFIDVKVKQLTRIKHYDEAVKFLVEERLREKAEGTFLWVALACRELSKPSVLSINTEEVLLELPTGITPLYTRIMDQVLTSSDERSTLYIKSILQSMIVALRPLTLPELAVAAGLPQQYHDKLRVLEEYVQQCGSMVTIRKRQAHFVHLSAKTYLQQAQFIHLSAKVHLLENGRGSIVSKDLRIEHRNMAVNCFEYIRDQSRDSTTEKVSSSRLGPTNDRTRGEPDNIAWLEYPVLFWLDHARQASDDIANHFDVGTDFFKAESPGRRTWFALYWSKTHSDHEARSEAFTSIHLAAYAGLPWLLLKIFELKLPRNLEVRDSHGNVPLLWAARNGYSSVLQLLLDKGAAIRAENHDGVTALYWAANNGHAACVGLLLKNGANCKPRDKVGWTSLHRAAFNGHTEIIRILLDNDADIEAMDSTRWTALMRAATTGNLEVTSLLLSKSANPKTRDMEGCTPLHHAAAFGHSQIIKLLLEYGADLEARDNEKWTVLHQAAWNGHEKTVKYVLKRGGDITAKADNGWTALHQATWNGHHAVVKRLLQEGADPNETDDEGETALHQAAWRGHDIITKLLLEDDADPNPRDRTGQTPLHQAASNGSMAAVKLLLDKCADPRAEDNDGRKPHSLAEENFHHSCAKVLRDMEMDVYGGEVLPDLENVPKTSHPGSHVDPAVIALLAVDESRASIDPYGQAGFSTPSKITTTTNGKTDTYFMKTGPDKEMFKGEYESLAALHAAVPSLCPQPIAHGKLADSSDHFILTAFIDIEASPGGQSSGLSLAQKLAQLHSTPVPIPHGFSRPVFGFHVPTCVGRTLQTNTWNRSWPKFFTENRLRAVWKTVQDNHGTDTELQTLLDRIIKEVVPRLLGNGHLGGREGIHPALVHGDLWSGNKARGRLGGKGGIEDVVFDAGSCYAHSEYELGIMRMFGGFSAGFFKEYHRLVPKTQPKSDTSPSPGFRYQWLNHYALFSGGYREDAMDCMEKLLEKYGKEDEDGSSSDLS
ncbi:MAG: hypothetical protein LQ348_003532 [Seirophora lacunosa]|nr:MAG: hypothetical protein LQ348_003532 [Seirophora lacunosa]